MYFMTLWLIWTVDTKIIYQQSISTSQKFN